MTSTILPHKVDDDAHRSGATRPTFRTIQDLLQRRALRLLDQACEEVLLQRLVRCPRTTSQHSMSFSGNIRDLNIGHGAIMAPCR